MEITKQPVVIVKDVFAGYDETPVLESVNLTIYEHDFMGIIGPNGGGKTTFIKVLLGLIKPTSGEIHFFDGGRKTEELAVGYLPQRNMIDHKFPITVSDVVLSGLTHPYSFFGRIRREHKEKVAEVLNQMGMYEYRNRIIGQLSGGQMQRVLLGRAIINQPKLLVLDEPNSYIDKHFEERLYEILTTLNKDTTILLVSHEITSLEGMVNRAVSIDRKLTNIDVANLHNHSSLL